MGNTYGQALKELFSYTKFGSRLGLKRIKSLLAALGNPQHSFKCILVGGSNGKGSTTEMIGSTLVRAGFRTATYYSPQIEVFAERFRVDGKNAEKKEIADAYFEVKEICGKRKIKATFFEIVTAMAFLIFKRRKVDCAVLEVGLGGRLDATNSSEPALSAITSISPEHTRQLGNTLSEIAFEKCGIARKGKALVCGFMPLEAQSAIRKNCGRIGAKPIFTEGKVKISKMRERGGKYSFAASFEGKRYSIRLSAPGEFQISNACVALAACAKLGIGRKEIENGISSVAPKYRLQRLSFSPLTIADCAHNPGAAEALSRELSTLPPAGGRKVLLFSAMKDKNYRSVLKTLAPHFDSLVLCTVPLDRSASLSELFAASKREFAEIRLVKTPSLALLKARKMAGRKGRLVIAGSIYLLAELFGRDGKIIGQ